MIARWYRSELETWRIPPRCVSSRGRCDRNRWRKVETSTGPSEEGRVVRTRLRPLCGDAGVDGQPLSAPKAPRGGRRARPSHSQRAGSSGSRCGLTSPAGRPETTRARDGAVRGRRS